MQQVAVEGVHRDRYATQSGGGPTEDAGLGRVGVHDIWPESPHLLDEVSERRRVRNGRRRTAQTVDPPEREPWGAQRQVVSLIRSDMAHVQPVIKPVRVDALNQSGNLESRSSDVHASDDAHHPQAAIATGSIRLHPLTI